MKKSLLVLTLILIMVAAFSLTACGNTPLQNILVAPWDKYEEVATYDVEQTLGENTLKGSMTVSYKRYNNKAVNSDELIATEKITGGFSSDSFYGLIVTTSLLMDDGQYKNSIIITDKQLRAKYSLSKQHFLDRNKDDGSFEDIEVEYKYDKEKCHYNVQGSIEKTGDIKYRKFNETAYFDNSFYIALTRTFGPVDSQRSLSFLTPSFRDDKMMKRVGGTTLQKVEIKPSDAFDMSGFTQPEDKEDKSTITCYRSTIASGETMPGSGTPINYYLSSIPYKFSDGTEIANVLLKFVEHDVTYTLREIKLVEVL